VAKEVSAMGRRRVINGILRHEFQMRIDAETVEPVLYADVQMYGERCFQEGYAAALEWVVGTNRENKEAVRSGQ
jgi:hypothetical protein